jgi:hypothetical protein
MVLNILFAEYHQKLYCYHKQNLKGSFMTGSVLNRGRILMERKSRFTKGEIGEEVLFHTELRDLG